MASGLACGITRRKLLLVVVLLAWSEGALGEEAGKLVSGMGASMSSAQPSLLQGGLNCLSAWKGQYEQDSCTIQF
eukprot:1635078-Amphidinium_carterae.1